MVVNRIDTEQIQGDHQYYYDWENQVYLDPPVSPESEVDTTPYLSAPINPTQIAQAPSELTLSALGIGKAEKMMMAYLEGKGGTEEKVVEGLCVELREVRLACNLSSAATECNRELVG